MISEKYQSGAMHPIFYAHVCYVFMRKKWKSAVDRIWFLSSRFSVVLAWSTGFQSHHTKSTGHPKQRHITYQYLSFYVWVAASATCWNRCRRAPATPRIASTGSSGQSAWLSPPGAREYSRPSAGEFPPGIARKRIDNAINRRGIRSSW